MLMTNDDAKESPDDGDEKTSREADQGSEETAMELSLLKKVRRWFAEGFLHGAEDRLLRADSSGILTELHFLLAQAVRYLRFPLDAAFAILDAEVGPDEEEMPAEKLECVLGLGSTSVSGGSTMNIGVKSNVRFRPTRLRVPLIVANEFMIVDFKIGKNSQLSRYADLPIPATSFCPGDAMPDLDVCEKGQFITVTVLNLDNSARIFAGSISGPPVAE
jgi:hypothetical protein